MRQRIVAPIRHLWSPGAGRRRDALVVLGLLVLPLLLFWDVTFGGKTMLPADNLFQWQPWRTYAAEFGVTTPQNSLLSDLILQNYPWKLFILDSMRARTIPLWSQHLFAGAPFLAKGQASVLYPFSLLFYVLPLPAAYGWFTVSQVWLAGVAMYGFGRILRQRRAAAALAALVYQGSGFMLVSAAVFPMILGAAVWLPLLLGCIDLIVRINRSPRGAGKTLPWAALGAAALGCQLLAGHPEITYYTLLIMALFAAWRLVTVPDRIDDDADAPSARRSVRRWLKPAGWLAAFVAVGLLLGAVQLVPLFEVGQTNFRQASASLAEVRGWAFPLRRVVTLALPNFFGNPAHHTYRDLLTDALTPFTTNFYGQPNPHGAGSSNWGIKNYVEGGIYLGIVPLLLAALGAVSSVWRGAGQARRAHGAFFGGLAFFSLAFIFGTPLYAILYYGLPFINQLHSPFRWVFALSLAVAVLAGFGLEALLAARRRAALWPAGLLALGGGAVVAGAWALRPLYGRVGPLVERVFLGLAQAPDAFPSATAFAGYVRPQLVTLGLVLLGGGVALALARRGRWWLVPLLALVIADLFLANRGFHAAVDPALLDFKPQLVQWLEAQPGEWRITAFEAHGDKPFNANSGWLFGLEDVRGYDSIIARQYTAYMAAIEPQNELAFNRIAPLHDIESINSPLLDLLGVKWVISAETLDPLPKLARVWEGEGLIVYENLAVVPRAYTIPHSAVQFTDAPLALMTTVDPRTTLLVSGDAAAYPPVAAPQPGAPKAATITQAGSLEVLVDAVVDGPAWLVLNDSYAPGWRAFARPLGGDESAESELPVELVNGNFRAVFLDDGGAYTVRFRYSPRSFILGALAGFMGGIIVVFAFGVWAWRRFYRQDGELTNTQSLAKNSMVPMALNLFNKLIDFAFAAFYLRVLGPTENGAYATAIAIAMWFEIVSNWGLNTLIIREVAQDRSQAGKYLFNTTLLRLFTTVIGALPVALYIGGTNLGGNPLSGDILLAIGLLAAGMLFSGMAQGMAGLFYAFESAEYPAAIATVTTILKVAFGVLVLLLGFSFVGLAGVSIVVNIVTLAILAALAFRRFPLHGPWRVDLPLQRTMFRISYPLMLNHLLATVFWQIDVPLLRQFNGEDPVGWYNAAYKWVNAFNVIPSFFTFALFPIISRQVQSNIDEARRTFRLSVKLLVLVALPLAAVVTLLADFMIGTLGGAEFLPDGAIALRLVMWSIPIGWINSVTNYTVISLGLERRLTRAFLLGVGFNIVGNLIVLPYLSYVGAALTTIASEIILLVAFNHFLQQGMPGVRWLDLLWRPVVVTLAMIGALWAGAQLHLLVGLAAGLVVYPLGLWLLRVFGAEERRILQAILPRPLAARLPLR